MNVRNEYSYCLLCSHNKASKIESHIVPKFMTKSILGESQIRRAYLLDPLKMDKPPIYYQDSEKESYILCDDCEKYFSVIENYIATRLHQRLWRINYSYQFPTHITGENIKYKICKEINPYVFRLFIYSIYWRSHIANTNIGKWFSLKESEAESLRKTLLCYKANNQSDFLIKIIEVKQAFQYIPFIIFTAENFADSTKNTIEFGPNDNPYYLVLNEYILILSFIESKLEEKLKALINNDNSEIKIGFLSHESWNKQNEMNFNFFIEKAKENLSRENKLPWLKGI